MYIHVSSSIRCWTFTVRLKGTELVNFCENSLHGLLVNAQLEFVFFKSGNVMCLLEAQPSPPSPTGFVRTSAQATDVILPSEKLDRRFV